jgi:hypothetical protein
LALLPQATCVVPHKRASVFAFDDRVLDASTARASETISHARVLITFEAALRVAAAAADADASSVDLFSAVERVGSGREGAIIFENEGSFITVQASRAAARAARWGRDDLFETTTLSAPWLTALESEPRLGPYLGGWG